MTRLARVKGASKISEEYARGMTTSSLVTQLAALTVQSMRLDHEADPLLAANASVLGEELDRRVPK